MLRFGLVQVLRHPKLQGKVWGSHLEREGQIGNYWFIGAVRETVIEQGRIWSCWHSCIGLLIEDCKAMFSQRRINICITVSVYMSYHRVTASSQLLAERENFYREVSIILVKQNISQILWPVQLHRKMQTPHLYQRTKNHYQKAPFVLKSVRA